MKALRIAVCLFGAFLLSRSAVGQTIGQKATALIGELVKDPHVVIVNDQVTVGEPHGPGGPHGDFQVVPKIKPGSPEYEAKVARLREKRRRDIQARLVALGPQAVPVIGGALNNQNLPYREYLAEALAGIDDKRAVPYLIDYLTEGHSKLRMAQSLAKVGNREQALKMKREAELIVGAALFSLETLTEKNYGNDIAKWRVWWEKNKSYYQ